MSTDSSWYWSTMGPIVIVIGILGMFIPLHDYKKLNTKIEATP